MAQDVGYSQCINCEATTLVRKDTNNRAYYKCNGSVDPQRRACGIEVKLGNLDSSRLIEQLEAQSADVIKNGQAARPEKAEPRDPAGSEPDDPGPATPAPTEDKRAKRKPLINIEF